MRVGETVLIESIRLLIRIPEVRDSESLVSYFQRNQRHLEAVEPLRSAEFYTREHWERQIPKFHDNFQDDRGLRLFAFLKARPELAVGAIEYSNFSRGPFQACNLGYSIDHEFEGKGFMIEALKATNRFVFENLGFHRIMANYLPHNQRSALLLKKLGFSVEGYARDYLKIQGKWQDHILTSLICSEPAQ